MRKITNLPSQKRKASLKTRIIFNKHKKTLIERTRVLLKKIVRVKIIGAVLANRVAWLAAAKK